MNLTLPKRLAFGGERKLLRVSNCKLLYQKGTQEAGMTGKPNSDSVPVKEKNIVATGLTKTILLVEDEDIVRSLARKLLEARGFSILEASSIEAARKCWGEKSSEIDLLLSDVLLPDGSTVSLVSEFQKEKPELRVIFTSGYSEDVVFAVKNQLNGAAFVQKPFHPRELMSLIDAALRKDK